MSNNDLIKFLKNIKQGFKKTISWNNYGSEITTQPNNNNLDYLIDPIFRNISRFFLLSFKNGNDDPSRNSFNRYYMPLVEMKKINILIDSKPFYNQPVKKKIRQGAYEKLIERSRNDDCTTGNVLDYFYQQNYYKLIINW